MSNSTRVERILEQLEAGSVTPDWLDRFWALLAEIDVDAAVVLGESKNKLLSAHWREESKSNRKKSHEEALDDLYRKKPPVFKLAAEVREFKRLLWAHYSELELEPEDDRRFLSLLRDMILLDLQEGTISLTGFNYLRALCKKLRLPSPEFTRDQLVQCLKNHHYERGMSKEEANDLRTLAKDIGVTLKSIGLSEERVQSLVRQGPINRGHAPFG